ncbi:MAG TPA: PrgI family protein [Patescibacteria group bacterium]|nr:PrgI family protein [Patescibacteria group bacterium]
MASYKVIQDVEAEDKLLGPLTLRQFIYALIGAVLLYCTYYAVAHGAGFLAAIFLPVVGVLGFFAFPWGRDQPTEIWALAKIRYLIKPRRRIWDQTGTKELVSITAPKHVNVDYTNGLTPTEVDSRLRALAQTIDSRGWAIKNSNINMATRNALNLNDPQSDRLVAPMALPRQVEDVDITAADDILDEQNNTVAQHLDTMISASSSARRQKIINNLQQPAPLPDPPAATKTASKPTTQPMAAGNYWFMNQPSRAASLPDDMVTFNTQVITPGTPEGEAANEPPLSDNEAELVNELEAHKHTSPNTAYLSHLHNILPPSSAAAQHAAEDGAAEQQPTTTPSAEPVAGLATGAGNHVPLPPVMPPIPTMPVTTPVQQAYPTPPPMQPPAQGLPQPPTSYAPVQPWVPPGTQPGPAAPAPNMTPASQTAILQLSRNDDLNVATIAREANRNSGEVVIKLH